MNFTHPFFPRHSCLCKGGAAPEMTPAPIAAPAPKPSVLQVPAPPAPPATASASGVAELDAKKAAAKRKGINSTILAAADANALGGMGSKPTTLLGGG